MKNIILSSLAMAFVMVSGNAQSKQATTKFSTSQIVTDYLALKNALTKDDTNGAAKSGKALYATFNSISTKSMDAKSKAEYLDIADDAKEHAEHIGANGGNIGHQREHFVMLSKDINDLIKAFGIEQNYIRIIVQWQTKEKVLFG
jgi:hypothetical protein